MKRKPKIKGYFLAIDPPFFGYGFTPSQARQQLLSIGGTVHGYTLLECKNNGSEPFAGVAPEFIKSTGTIQ